MEERKNTEGRAGSGRKILLGTVLVFAAIVALACLALQLYLASPYPAASLSRILSDSLKERVLVTRVERSGTTIHLKGVRLSNPPGFPAGNLLSADALAIAPDWLALVSGRRSFRLLGVDGLRIDAVQNGKGEWNFSHLQRYLASQKPSPVDTVIRHLSVKNGSLSVNGRAFQGISLEVFNLTSKGSLDSSLALQFQDAWRNRYSVKGRARPGGAPAVDLSLTADPFSLDPLVSLLPAGARRNIRGGRGSVALRVALESGVVTCDGRLDFSGLRVSAGGSDLPLSGRLTLAGGYREKGDEATLKSLVLALDHLATVRGSGGVKELRHARTFRAELSMDEADLSRLPFLLPERERSRTRLGGKISCRTVRLAGTGAVGLTGASGALLLRGARLERDGRAFFSGLHAEIDLQRAKEGILATGRAGGRATGPALLERVDAGFQALLSPKLKPLSGRVSLPAARVSGIDLAGRLVFDAASATPYTVSAEIPGAAASGLNPFLAPYNLKLTSGRAALSLSGTGRSASDFAAALNCRLSGVAGSRGEKEFGVGSGTVECLLQKKGGAFAGSGRMRLSALSFAGKEGDADFSYRLSGKVLTLENGVFRSAGSSAGFATLTATVPQQEGSGYPVAVEVTGGSFRDATYEAKGVSGNLLGRYLSDPQGSWLEGSAALAAERLSWKGKEVGAPTAHLSFSRSGGKGTLGGTVLGGGLKAEVAYQPFVPEREEFKVTVAGAQLKALSALLPAGKRPTLSQGTLDLAADGSYARNSGVSCRFQGSGKGIEVKGVDGKALLAGGGLSVKGALAGEKLTLGGVEVTAGAGARLLLQGEVEKAFSPQRVGRLTFSVPHAALNDLIDPFVNLLPRMLQEATTGGALAADGTVALHDGKELLEGTVLLDDVRLAVPSQKLVVSGVQGKVPVSLDLAGKESGKPGTGLVVSRENFPRLLQQLQQGSAATTPFSIGKVSYGTLDLGPVIMELHAESGVTEIRSLRTSLYDGMVLGKGSVSLEKGGTFRVDLLASEVSLKSICNAIPNIKGYISGRIDGVLSLSGTGKGLKGLVGFTEFWAREGKGERMLVSKEFLQRLSNQKLSGFFFSSDRRYDRAEIRALLQEGDLTFQALEIQHTNLLGVRDLSVSIVPSQNRIALDHLLDSIKEAATRGKTATGAVPGTPAPSGTPPGKAAPNEAPSAEPEFKWQE